MNTNIPVVFATNKNYVSLLMVAMKSIVDCASSDIDYNIYILHTELDQGDADLLKTLEKNNLSVSLFSVKDTLDRLELNDLFFGKGMWSVETFYRLLVPELLPEYDKIIYLDCDVIVKKDLKYLFEHDVTNHLLAGVPQRYDGGFRLTEFQGFKVPYFNAGVLLFHAKKWREENYTQKAIDTLKEKDKSQLMLLDQDILNLLAMNKVLWLSPKWNFLNAYYSLFVDHDTPLLDLKENTMDSFYILHYSEKAHINLFSYFAMDFWNTAKTIPHPTQGTVADYFYDTNMKRLQAEKKAYACDREERWTNFLIDCAKNQTKEFCFFGAGLRCIETMHFFKQKNFPLPVAVCDNSPILAGQEMEGVSVFSLEDILKKYPDISFLITNDLYKKEIESQLLEKIAPHRILEFTV